MKSRWIVLILAVIGVLSFSGCGGVSMGGSNPTQTQTTYTIGGTVSGLTGTGLVLQNNNANNLPVAASATSFTFATPIASGSAYSVTVLTQPSGQTCTVTSGSGTATGDVTSVVLTCSAATYTIGGTISGLTGAGLVLQDNLADNLTVLAAATSFTFGTPIAAGSTYTVTVLTQPTGQTCSVTAGSGTANADVTSVAVTCITNIVPSYTISASVSGLTGTGLVLQDNGGNNLSITGNGTFPFTTQIPSGGTYAVTVFTQPSGQTCALGSNASGTASGNVTVTVTCSSILYTISAAVSGLTGTGLVLQDNGGNNLSITGNGTFPFTTQIPSGGSYAVTVLTQPTNQTCALGSNASGTASGNVTVTVTCTSILYTISASVSGLTGTGLVLQDNGGNNLTITANGTFPFTTQIPSGGAYAVTILTQPSGQSCTLGSNASGTASGDVTVAVTCGATTLYTISAAVSGLTGTGLVLQDNGGDNLSVTANGTFPFITQIPSGGAYAVTILTQPTGQTCTLGSNASGTASGNVTVAVTCSATTLYTISVAVSGLTGTGLVFQDNGGNNLSVTTNGTFPFTTQIPSGGSYAVTVFTEPSGQTCSLGSNASGTASGNVTVAVTCTASTSTNTWTWQNGSSSAGQGGNYGTPPTRKVFNSTNVPGARYGSVTWTDASGNLWLFGGFGDDINDNEGLLNDLWEWNGSQWAWISGGNSIDQNGVYGTGGTSIPGARYGAVGWKDTAGNFWLFGGYGLDSNPLGTAGQLNDLWEFTGGVWDYISGSEFINPKGIYGTSGSGNIPGGRYSPTAYTDASGNFWLFGGEGLDSTGAVGSLNDLWEYSTSTGNWEWISGSKTQGQSPTYGTMGQGATGNVPGARQGSVSWIDLTGNFWLFGGLGIDSTKAYGSLNDLWEYFPSSGEWAWQGPTGSNVANQPGNYVALGQAGTPGGRLSPSGWLDSSQNFWLFGGQEIGGDGLNDLWEYSAGTWTWVSGSSSPDQLGTYPSTVGTTGPTFVPGSRYQSASWIDTNNNLWLFGGFGAATAYPVGVLNDLWEYQP